MVVDISKQQELEWIRLKQDLDNEIPETLYDKGIRKFKQNPFVPIGCAATTVALTYGIWNFAHGRSQMSQYMMRARVIAQGATIVAVLVGVTATLPKNKD